MTTARALLALALDPARIFTAQGRTPDPWQRQLLARPERQVLLNCSRQSGKSSVAAALAVHAALFQPGSLILLVSPSLRQSAELFRKVLEGYRAVGQPIPIRAASQTRLELANHSRVISLPGNEETIRSFGNVALLVLDEAARVPDDLYRAVRPMLAVSRGRLVCLSTPFGMRGFFHREWTDPGATWQRVRVTWQECPRITADFIAAERQAMGESWYRQEYECSFEALEGLVYPDFANACGFAPASPPTVGGIDFGYRNPFAAVWGHQDSEGILWITGERYERQQTIVEHARHLPRKVTWYADPAGAQEIATLRTLGLVVRRGVNEIRAGIAAVRARLEAGKLRVVRESCPNLLAEAQLYRYPDQADGGDRETPVDDHNHALAALRYLVTRLDAEFIRKYGRRSGTGSD
ncbi:hypothetical protein AYO44_10580 [Planctomycetaceae bacterium SCGC AG-212-F19]|nr:hypothetical protein AYO44_10580 [Planctomycetaceae bacterium SCGC AG-212-F19]